MKLTCVTATFNCIKAGNRERLIRCVESVAKLKTEHEHLIFDGASTDGTVELLRELEVKIPNLKVVSEPDTGIYNALNKGVRDAKGEWFYVLGADDYICAPEVMDGLLCEEECDQIVTPVKTSSGMREITIEKVFLSTPYCHQGVIQKTEMVQQFSGFDEQYRISADFDLFLKCHVAGLNIRYIDKVFAFFEASGISSTAISKMVAEFNNISAKFLSVKMKNVEKMRARGHITFVKSLRYFFHRDFALRNSSRKALRENIKDVFRVLLWPIVIIRRKIRDRIKAVD